MRTIDDNGVGIRYVDTVLYDSSREQHIIVVIREVENNLFQLLRLHLSMTYCNTGIGNVLLYDLGYVFKIGNSIVDKINLTITGHLEVYSLRQNLGRESMYLGLYGITVRRRSLDNTKIARANQRELESTRNWCSRHSEGVDRGLHLTKFLLGRDSELLLLVDDKQTKILEL